MSTDSVITWMDRKLEEEGYTYENDDEVKDIIKKWDKGGKKGNAFRGFLNGSQFNAEEYRKRYGGANKKWDGFFNENKGQTKMEQWITKSNTQNSTFKKNIADRLEKAIDDNDLDKIQRDLNLSDNLYHRSTIQEIRAAIVDRRKFLNETTREADTFVREAKSMRSREDLERVYEIAETELEKTGDVQAWNNAMDFVRERIDQVETLQEATERKVMAQIEKAKSFEALDSIDPELGVTYDQTDRFKEAIAIQRNRLRQI